MLTDFFTRFGLLAGALLATLSFASLWAQDPPGKQPPPGTKPAIPETWDEARLESLHVPLADATRTPKHVPKEYYTSFPVRPIYKSYDVYRPDREPKDYLEWLKKQEPEVVWDEKTSPPLNTEADWIRAGEIVFDAPLTWENGIMGFNSAAVYVRDPEWYKSTQAALTADGKLPFYRYVIRTKGKVEVGVFACAMCHTRVLPDKSVVKGAQGNFPFGTSAAYEIRKTDNAGLSRRLDLSLFGAPWLRPDPQADLAKKSVEDIAAAHEVVPPGVLTRHGTGAWSPVQVPDLIGLKDRKYLDRTGLVRHRDIGDVMRYSALNQDADRFALHGDFRSTAPNDKSTLKKLPPPRRLGSPGGGGRYTDVQLYALAKYVYALKPPANPNLPKTDADRKLVARGEAVFDQLRCARCHSGEQYSNNKLTPVDGFTVPAEHREKYDILEESVGTDPTLALGTRRGTGYYKVPSLRGVWYRGPFEHNGSVATLEEWFDPRRLRSDYEPTGWKGLPGAKTRAVPGHRFGLNLPLDDRRALIAFLKTL